MPTITTPPRWAWYHVVLHIVGAVIAVGAIVCLVLMIIWPEHPVIRSVAIVTACLAAIVTASAAVHHAVWEIGQTVRASVDAGSPDIEVLGQSIREEMRGIATTQRRAVEALAERVDGLTKQLSESAAASADLDGIRREFDAKLAAAVVEILRTQESGSVTYLHQRQRTAEP